MADEFERKDIEAGLGARQELGDAFDAELVAGFADRIEKSVQERVGSVAALSQHNSRLEAREATNQFVLGIISAGVGVPISITLGVTDNLGALVVSWIGVVGVNVAHAWSRKHRR